MQGAKTAQQDLALGSSSDSIFKQQIRLRDEMLALPVPSDASSYEYPSSMSCNKFAELLALEPQARDLAAAAEAIQRGRHLIPDARLRILSAMVANYRSALGDPLKWRKVSEIDIGPNTVEAFFLRMESTRLRMEVLDTAPRTQEDYRAQQLCETQVAEMYAEHPLQLQAGLLMAYFGGSERPSSRYLAKWFGECDVAADRQVIEAYLVAAKTRDNLTKLASTPATVLERWTDTAGRALEDRLRKSVEEDRKRHGMCIVCGKRLTWSQRLLRVKRHNECTVVVD